MNMTPEDKARLEELRQAGTLNRQQIDDLLVLTKLEEADAKPKKEVASVPTVTVVKEPKETPKKRGKK